MGSPRGIELLAPARDAKTAVEAINHGADAVYIGADSFGARVNAGNSVSDIAEVVEYAHKFNVKVYVTLNTIIKNEEIKRVERLIAELYAIGVDALIVQDMGILRMNIPPIDLHASTQCDIADLAKAKFIDGLGFSQMVLARELSLAQIKEISESVKADVEVFVHGALCVSYSGRCHASHILKGRSANRGECAQICRLPFDLFTAKGDRIVASKHLLSLRDMNRHDRVEELLEAGVSSLKIEGRLKDINYVKNVVAAYRSEIDKVIERYPNKYCRTSVGVSRVAFNAQLDKSFNRGFTNYFLDSQRNAQETQVASIKTPKSMGEYIGRVKRAKDRVLILDTDIVITNGDGISYFDDSDKYTGLRVNKVLNRELYMTQRVAIKPNSVIYRTFDKGFDDLLSGETATRRVLIDMELNKTQWGIALTVRDELGRTATTSMECELEMARSDQSKSQASVLSKLGSTVYMANNLSLLNDWFIPASMLTNLRRDVLVLLERCNKINFRPRLRGIEDMTAKFMRNKIYFADNISNDLAKRVYLEHGVEYVEPALEVTDSACYNGDEVLMTTKYCLLNELGECKCNANSKFRDEELYPMRLVNGANLKLSVEFDCAACQMIIRKC